MNEIHDIFQSSNDAVNMAIMQSVNLISQKVSGFDFDSKLMVSLSDEAVSFYTSGAIVTDLLKRNKCESCIKMLTNNKESLKILVRSKHWNQRKFELNIWIRANCGAVRFNDFFIFYITAVTGMGLWLNV